MQKFIPSKVEGLIPISEAAKFLDVSIDTVRRYDKLGILHSTRPSGKVRYFDLEELKKAKYSKALITKTHLEGVHTATFQVKRNGGLLKRASLFLVRIIILAVTILTILFLLFPEKMARFLTSFM